MTLCRHEDAVLDLVREVWTLRQNRRLKADPLALGRRISRATLDVVDADETYDPENDARVLWLRSICRSMRSEPYKTPHGTGDEEAWVMFILDQIPKPWTPVWDKP
jgi:hypothetical protein